jgi:4-hydroxybenzoate polyprenyltransferase
MLPKTPSRHYLCIDLDGTLVQADTFGEAVLGFLHHSPLRVLNLFIWLLRGRSFLKMKICEAAPLAAENLPYNSPLIDYIKDKKANGSTIVLATGAHHSFATQVAEHLGIFDEVLSSDGRQNLVGANKARVLGANYPGFQYAGNSRADLPVWKQSAGAILVSDSTRLLKLLKRSSIPIIRVIPQKRSGPVAWMRALRVHQWVKNTLVLLPIVTSHRLGHWPTLRAGLISMVAFSFAASAIYIINDLLDIPDDRLHARKRRRPFAAGDLTPQSGVWAAVLCSGLAVTTGAMIPVAARYLLLLYVVMTIAYSVRFKRFLIADLMLLVGFYLLRVLYGGMATGITVSVWLLAFSLFFFLSLAFVKRLSELRIQQTSHRLPGRAYGPEDVNLIGSLAGSSAYSSVLVFALYINSQEVIPLYHRPQILWAICAALIYWLSRLILISNRGHLHDDPIVFAFRDRASLVTGFVIALLIYAAS